MIKLPLLFDSNMQPVRPLRPVGYSLKDNLTPLSTASLTIEAEADVQLRDFVQLFTEDGSAGVFRVNNIRADGESVAEVSLQHGLCTLGDHMHPGESTETGSCRTLLTKILSNQSRWALGTVDVPDDEDLAWECNNTNDLQGLLSVMKDLPAYYLDFDQSALPWLLHVRRKPTEVSCEARFNRNLTDVEYEYDDTDMCTLAYADGLDAPIKADTYDKWHEIARYVSVDEELGVDVITETVERYLEQAKNPKVTITLTAIELSRLTGEPFDHFRKGMLCRCILEHMTVIQRIESIERPDPIDDPMHVKIVLASTQNDLSVTVAGLVVDTRHVNQLYQQLERNLRIEADTIDMLAAEIDLKATKAEVDGVSTRIAEAEIQLNEVLGQLALRVTYNELGTQMNDVGALLDAVNAELLLKATHSDLEDGFNEVSFRLNAMDNTIAAKADLILLDGYVKMADFEAIQGWTTDFSGVSISGSSIIGGYGDFDELVCGQLDCSSLTIGGDALTKTSLTVVTGIDVKYTLEGRVSAVQPITTQFYYFT